MITVKKLLIATDSFLPRWDGIARFLNEIIPKLAVDYEIKVLAPDFEGEFKEYIDVDVVRFPLSRMRIADYPVPKPSYKEIRKHVKWADIVWTHTIGPIGAMTIMAARKEKKKLLAYIHSIEWVLFPRSLRTISIIKWVVHKTSAFISKRLYNKCDLLLVPSAEVAELLDRKGVRVPKKVVHVGTNTKIFSPPESKAKAKEAIGIMPNTLVVGFAGRIGLEKDLETLYRAFGRINRKHDALLLIVGQDLRGVTKRFQSNPKVRLEGSTNNIVPYMQAMDVYVLSSLTETSSLSTIEAMSCGAAVISTPVGYVKEYIKEGFNGMFFPKKNAYELSKKMDKLLKDEFLRKRLGENSRRTIIDRFSWDKTVNELKEVFDKI